MKTLYTYRETVNNDSIFINTYSSDIEKIATNIQCSLKYQIEKYGYTKIGILGLVETEARDQAREKLLSQGISITPKYLKAVTEFYSSLIKDELLRRLA